jgi:pimeloyl-ACP methyl ester carboxylesterase
MRESSQVVRIERHRIAEDLVALTYDDPSRSDALAAPFVIVLHGLGSRKERHLDLCLRLAAGGAIGCGIDARGHGDRATADSRRVLADQGSPEFLPAFAETVAGTVGDVTEIATYFRTRRYNLIGHSMGGFVALQTALVDPRVESVVCIAGALDMSEFDENALSPAVRESTRVQDPVINAGGFPPRRVLLLHGDADQTVPVSGARRLAAALRAVYGASPEDMLLREFPGAGHDLLPEMAADAVRWTVERKGSGVPDPSAQRAS